MAGEVGGKVLPPWRLPSLPPGAGPGVSILVRPRPPEQHFLRGLSRMRMCVGLALTVMMALASGQVRAGCPERMRSLYGPVPPAFAGAGFGPTPADRLVTLPSVPVRSRGPRAGSRASPPRLRAPGPATRARDRRGPGSRAEGARLPPPYLRTERKSGRGAVHTATLSVGDAVRLVGVALSGSAHDSPIAGRTSPAPTISSLVDLPLVAVGSGTGPAIPSCLPARARAASTA